MSASPKPDPPLILDPGVDPVQLLDPHLRQNPHQDRQVAGLAGVLGVPAVRRDLGRVSLRVTRLKEVDRERIELSGLQLVPNRLSVSLNSPIGVDGKDPIRALNGLLQQSVPFLDLSLPEPRSQELALKTNLPSSLPNRQPLL
jgi:hypothetical protein